jgi:hypothetical protein
MSAFDPAKVLEKSSHFPLIAISKPIWITLDLLRFSLLATWNNLPLFDTQYQSMWAGNKPLVYKHYHSLNKPKLLVQYLLGRNIKEFGLVSISDGILNLCTYIARCTATATMDTCHSSQCNARNCSD